MRKEEEIKLQKWMDFLESVDVAIQKYMEYGENFDVIDQEKSINHIKKDVVKSFQESMREYIVSESFKQF